MNFGTTTSSGYTFPIGSTTNPGGISFNNQMGEAFAESLSNDQSDTVLSSLYANDSPEDALKWLKLNNPELYYELVLQRDNNRLEWERYKDYQRNYYDLQKESLRKAGLNPWLALQNFGSIGTGSVGGSIGSMSNPTSTIKAQREAKDSDLLKGVGVAGIGLIGAILGLLIAAL